MARTATKVTPQENISVANPEALTISQENVLEAEVSAENVDNYPMLLTLAATNNPDQLPPGAKTADQAREYIREVQRQGFKILTCTATESGEVNGIFTQKMFVFFIKGQ